MSEPITKELRETLGKMWSNPELLEIADRIDREHKSRLDDCRHNTKRALVRYLRGVLTDYDRGIKRVRKEDKAEVVRCKDCQWSRPLDGRIYCAYRPYEQHFVEFDGYCSDGERKEVSE